MILRYRRGAVWANGRAVRRECIRFGHKYLARWHLGVAPWRLVSAESDGAVEIYGVRRQAEASRGPGRQTGATL